jgi:two-component system OmpR family sensor kinase
MSRLGLKARLTLWHGAAVALILAVAVVVGDRLLTYEILADLDAALLSLAETEAASSVDDPLGDLHLHEVSAQEQGSRLRRLDRLVQVVDRQGTVLLRSATLGSTSLPASPAVLSRIWAGDIVMETADLAGEPVRMVSLRIPARPEVPYAIQVGTPLRTTLEFLGTVRLLFLAVSAVILCAVVAIGAVLARKALRPIDRVVAQARGIGESSLHQRLPDPGARDELGRLVGTLNEMLDRVERTFESQRRFTADASHEMRSPLSRLQNELEVTLRRPRTAEEYAEALRSALEETERLTELTEALLTLARLDAGDVPPAPSSIALRPLLEREVERHRPEADRRSIRLVLDAPPGLTAACAPELLRLAIRNLLDNALRFSPARDAVAIQASADAHAIRVTVSDRGPGIPPGELPHVFERFYRGTAARSPDARHIGLGLAITRAIVEAHRGSLTVESRPGRGATFAIRLPRPA